MKLILRGTADAMTSTPARKVLAAASYASVHISCEEVPSSEAFLRVNCPVAKSLVLLFGGQPVASFNASMRAIASIAPASGLLGRTAVEDAMVDSWLSFVWSSIDLPLYAAAQEYSLNDNQLKTSIAVQMDVDRSLAKVEAHLLHHTYLVGDSISLADISLAISLKNRGGEQPKAGSNLLRWYQTVANQLALLD